MKIMKAALMGALVCFASSASAADVFGTWLTEKSDKGRYMAVEVFECGDRVCGKSVEVFGTDDRTNVGIEIIKGMKKKAENAYSRGKIYAPDTKKWYKSKMSLKSENKLKVSGCILGGVICRSQVWTRQ